MTAERVFIVARKEFADRVTGWHYLAVLALFLGLLPWWGRIPGLRTTRVLSTSLRRWPPTPSSKEFRVRLERPLKDTLGRI